VSVPEEPTDQVRRLIAVGRFVRLADDPDAAEVAIVVADDWQRRAGWPRPSPSCLPRALVDSAVAASPRRSPATTSRRTS
jgi:hypothetical protein